MGEIDIILEDASEAERESSGLTDEILDPLPGPAITQVGDVWVLGQHRLLCGDARDGHAYKALLLDEKAEIAFTDPPYNVRIDGHVCGQGKVQHREFLMASGEMSAEAFIEFLKTTFLHLAEHTTDGAMHFIFMDRRHTGAILSAGDDVYSELKNICVWAKTNAGMGSLYRSQHELVFVFKSGTGPHINNIELGRHGRNRSNVWTYAGVNTIRPGRLEELAMHPTVKPVVLVGRRHQGLFAPPRYRPRYRLWGREQMIIAAEQTGRRARGIEIDRGYADVAVRRWQTYTGKTATLAATGQTFEEIEEERKHLDPPPPPDDRTLPADREAA